MVRTLFNTVHEPIKNGISTRDKAFMQFTKSTPARLSSLRSFKVLLIFRCERLVDGLYRYDPIVDFSYNLEMRLVFGFRYFSMRR